MIFKLKIPSSELNRIDNLIHLKILDTEQEAAYSILAEFVTSFMNAPIGGVALLDDNKQWLLPKKGFEWGDVPVESSFSTHAFANPDEIFVVKNAALDPRFENHPYVIGPSKIRFFVAAPLMFNNKPIGTLCVADTVPRQSLDVIQIEILKAIAKLAVAQFELRQFIINIYDEIRELKKFPATEKHQLDLAALYERADFLLEKIKARRAG